MAQKQDITAGILVHFVQLNNTHSAAIITTVTDPETNTVNLFIIRDDAVVEQYTRRAVKYSESLEPETWHFIEGHKTWTKKP